MAIFIMTKNRKSMGCSRLSIAYCADSGEQVIRGAFNTFPDFFVQAFKIVIDS